VRRREFITLLGGAPVAWPLATRAQQLPVIGYLAPSNEIARIGAFREGLKTTGFFEGHNVVIDVRSGPYDQIPALAKSLVARGVAVIAAVGTFQAQSARSITSMVPIVFVLGSDAIKLGLASSLNRPGTNATGVSFISHELVPKHLELLRELLPSPDLIGVLLNPNNPNAEDTAKEVSKAAAALSQRIQIVNASSDQEFRAAITSLSQRQANALLIGSDAFFNSRPQQLVSLAASYRMPTIFAYRLFAEAGGLMSYGASVSVMYRQAGMYVGRILNGERAADLPIVQPAKFELVINLNTAKAFGITVPPTLVARADEVIE
jgi:putative ABC transport system substrate-binding protein